MVGSFGTWRDAEGRLSWGVDDFDESYPLPYTNDLVRLAASVKIVIDSEELTIRFKEGCSAILEGYEKALKAGGCPFVLAEHEKKLDRLGVEAFEPPNGFWEKLDHLRVVHHGPPRDVKRVLGKTLPNPNLDYKVVRRVAGLGSLGNKIGMVRKTPDGTNGRAYYKKTGTSSDCTFLSAHTSAFENVRDLALFL